MLLEGLELDEDREEDDDEDERPDEDEPPFAKVWIELNSSAKLIRVTMSFLVFFICDF